MKSQAEEIQQLADICTRAAAGDLEARACPLPENPELAALAIAINRVLDVTDAYVRDSTAAMKHCSRGEYHRAMLLRGMNGAYRDAAMTINQAARSSTAPSARKNPRDF